LSETPAEKPDQGAALKAAYTEATRRLREQHKKEFDSLRTQVMTELGFPDWTPPLTAEEKAEQQMAELLAAHPSLIDKITGSGGGRRAAETPPGS